MAAHLGRDLLGLRLLIGRAVRQGGPRRMESRPARGDLEYPRITVGGMMLATETVDDQGFGDAEVVHLRLQIFNGVQPACQQLQVTAHNAIGVEHVPVIVHATEINFRPSRKAPRVRGRTVVPLARSKCRVTGLLQDLTQQHVILWNALPLAFQVEECAPS